jgi:hypothetical protein
MAEIEVRQEAAEKDVLRARGLPLIESRDELATVLGMSLARLRWLAFEWRSTARATAQRWVLEQILARLPAGPPVVAAPPSTPGDAPRPSRVHLDRSGVHLDLRGFFHTITFRRVRGLFHKLGYSSDVATTLALLCTEPAARAHDGRPVLLERVLPSGACTSLAITHALCRRLDRRLAGLARRHHAAYARSTDDLAFSTDEPAGLEALLPRVCAVIRDEGFVAPARPTREEVRRLRAILHNAALHGLQSQNREGHHDFAAHLRGRVAELCQVDPQRAPAFRAALARALRGPSPTLA